MGGKKSEVATNIIRIVWTFFISNGHRYLHYLFVTPCDVLDTLHNKEVFSEKSCFKNFAHPLSEGENIKNKI